MTGKPDNIIFKTSPLVKTILVISLAVNLLIAGMAAGMMLRPGGMRHTDPNARDVGFKVLVNALSRKDRFDMGRALRSEFGERTARLPAAREQINALVKALEAQNFEGAKVESILRSNAINIIPRQDAALRLLIDRLTEMSAKERLNYIERLDRAMRMDMGNSRQ